MQAVVEAKSMFRVVPRTPDQQKGEWLRVVGSVFGLTYSQAKKIEYEEVDDMRASRLDAMRATFTELQERAKKRRETLDELTNQLAALRSSSGSGDPVGRVPGTVSPHGRGGGEGESSLRADRPRNAVVPRT